jgi:hypothetical protein
MGFPGAEDRGNPQSRGVPCSASPHGVPISSSNCWILAGSLSPGKPLRGWEGNLGAGDADVGAPSESGGGPPLPPGWAAPRGAPSAGGVPPRLGQPRASRRLRSGQGCASVRATAAAADFALLQPAEAPAGSAFHVTAAGRAGGRRTGGGQPGGLPGSRPLLRRALRPGRRGSGFRGGDDGTREGRGSTADPGVGRVE